MQPLQLETLPSRKNHFLNVFACSSGRNSLLLLGLITSCSLVCSITALISPCWTYSKNEVDGILYDRTTFGLWGLYQFSGKNTSVVSYWHHPNGICQKWKENGDFVDEQDCSTLQHGSQMAGCITRKRICGTYMKFVITWQSAAILFGILLFLCSTFAAAIPSKTSVKRAKLASVFGCCSGLLGITTLMMWLVFFIDFKKGLDEIHCHILGTCYQIGYGAIASMVSIVLILISDLVLFFVVRNVQMIDTQKSHERQDEQLQLKNQTKESETISA